MAMALERRKCSALGLLLLALAAPALTWAGEVAKGEEEYETPLAPAFVILGVNPTTIARPTTPRAFAVEALSLVSAAQDGLPQTYALQVTPYWLKNHPELSFHDYVSASFGQMLLHNLTFSVATTPESDLTPEAVPGLGLGVRSMWFVGVDTAEIIKKDQELKAAANEENKLWEEADKVQAIVDGKDEEHFQRNILTIQVRLNPAEALEKVFAAEVKTLTTQITAAAGDVKEALEREKSLVEERQKALTVYLELERKSLEQAQKELEAFKKAQTDIAEIQVKREQQKKRGKELAQEVAKLLPRRGVAIETAFALGISVPSEEDRSAEVSRMGAWVTASYRTTDGIELLGLLRILENDLETERESRFFDYGGRIVARGSVVTVSAELVRRTAHHDAGEIEDSTRLAGVVEVPVSDDIKLNFTLAKDFKSRAITGTPVLGILGASFQFGKTPPLSPKP